MLVITKIKHFFNRERSEGQEWLDGLMFAESIGSHEASKMYATHAGFSSLTEPFDKGILDYIHHSKRIKEVTRDNNNQTDWELTTQVEISESQFLQ